ncbi:complexin-3-like [Hyperolius riggenbachi]|uniref:complexin-3-like n=1 Tax=Hyperolius riggenbachi TaxID=752182 RepID=UPI0035A29CA1
MASMVKSLFGAPVKSKSCCTSGAVPQDLRPPQDSKRITRRWSSDEQHRKVPQPDMSRRTSLFAQQKAERAVMREHFRQKYNLAKNTDDRQRLKEAGSNIRLPKDLRTIMRQEKAEEVAEEVSFVRLISYKNLETGVSTTMASLPPVSRCLLM